MNSQTHNDILKKLENELSYAKNQVKDSFVLIEKSIGLCSKAISELREIVLEYGFKNNNEEIHFFKYIKPKVNSKFIFYTELFHIESHKPVSDKGAQIRFLRDCLQKFCNKLKDYKEFYHYYKMKKTFSDHNYFIRGNAEYRIHMDHIPNHIDPEFSTGYDITLAKILACEQLKKYIGNEIEKLKYNSNEVGGNINRGNQAIHLEWTGPQIALTELVYALYYAKVINNGQAGINEIARAFEEMFKVNLDEIYRSFKDIQGRTTVRTRFLDNLREVLLKRLDELDK